jgi:hypothetical protein
VCVPAACDFPLSAMSQWQSCEKHQAHGLHAIACWFSPVGGEQSCAPWSQWLEIVHLWEVGSSPKVSQHLLTVKGWTSYGVSAVQGVWLEIEVP